MQCRDLEGEVAEVVMAGSERCCLLGYVEGWLGGQSRARHVLSNRNALGFQIQKHLYGDSCEVQVSGLNGERVD